MTECEKKIIFVYGSDRPNSRSAVVMREMEKKAAEAGAVILRYNLAGEAVLGCRGCGVCRADNTNCIREDALTSYFEEVFSADAVVVSAPIYLSQVSGQNISFMNRHFCVKTADKQNRLPAGIKIAAVYAQGAPESYTAYRAAEEWYLSCFGRYGLEPVRFISFGSDTDLSADGAVMQDAGKLIGELLR